MYRYELIGKLSNVLVSLDMLRYNGVSITPTTVTSCTGKTPLREPSGSDSFTVSPTSKPDFIFPFLSATTSWSFSGIRPSTSLKRLIVCVVSYECIRTSCVPFSSVAISSTKYAGSTVCTESTFFKASISFSWKP